jgi:probable rRNA maturation factor
MIVYEPAVELKLPRAARPRRRELARFLRQAIDATGLVGDVSVLLTGDEAIRTLNRNFRRKDKATDVLSFPAAEGMGDVAGDLAISLETAFRQAKEHQHTLEMEIRVLLLHGLLHLAGHDHETDNGTMHRKEVRLRRELGLTAALIERAQRGQAKPGRARQDRAKRGQAQRRTSREAARA